MSDGADELGRRYAPVLETVVELMGSSQGLSFGEALDLAVRKHGVTQLPKEAEEAILLSAFKIIASGRIPGAPDA